MNDSAICIIGDTPLARVLAAKFHLAGEQTVLMTPQNDKILAEPFWLREENTMQKRQITIPVTGIMPPQPKLVIFALSPEHLKAGLTLFSNTKAHGCPVLSFCRTGNSNYISQVLQRPIIQAYFSGWLNTKGNDTLLLLGSTASISVNVSERHTHFNLLQKLLAKTYFKISFSADDAKNFWGFFIQYASCALFSLQNRAKIRDITKDAHLRSVLNNILDEIISAVPADIAVDKDQILSDIYSTPSNWISPITSSIQESHAGELMFIADTLKQYHMLSAYPTCRKIINESAQKVLSSVE